jgi:polysaccharide biosynthesis transport protein
LVHFASDSPLLQQLQERESRLRTEYVDASQAYGPMFPKVKRLQAQVDEVQSLIGREQKRIIEAINHDYTVAKTRESLLSDAVAKQKAEVARLNELAIRHNLLRRDFQSNQALYDNLMQQMKDAMVSAGLRITNVQMLDRAFPPAEADRPRRARNIMVGSVAGLILGFLCSLMRETIDTSVKRAEELEVLTGVPTFSIIPDAMKVRKSSGKRRCMQPSHRSVSKALLSYPESALAESFRALRTSILLSKTDGAPQVLLVTSPNAREGKTCTAVNLAMALAQKGDQVLLVDADFRRPTAGIILGISNNSGLSGILTGASELGQAVVQFAQLETLSVLPAGPYPQNAAELLSSAAMPKLVAELRPRFKYIVIDAPPVLLITDATILASIADGVIMVAVSEVTKRGALLRAFRIISLCQGRILGSVLNKVDVRRNGYYGYYYSRTSNHGIVDLQTSG